VPEINHLSSSSSRAIVDLIGEDPSARHQGSVHQQRNARQIMGNAKEPEPEDEDIFSGNQSNHHIYGGKPVDN
jgi:hypothetical protein